MAGPISACVFDLDGTLVDTLGDFTLALNQMLQQIGRKPLPRERVGRMVGKGNEFLLRSALAWPQAPDSPGAPTTDDALYRTAHSLYLSAYRALNGQHSTVFPGVVEALQALRERAHQEVICLVYGARDEAHNNAVVVRDLLLHPGH